MAFKGLEPGYPIHWGAGDRVRRPGLSSSLPLGESQASAEWVPIPRWPDQGACGICSLRSVCRAGIGDRFIAACGAFNPSSSSICRMSFFPGTVGRDEGVCRGWAVPGNIPEVPDWRNNISVPGDWAKAEPGCLSHPPFSQPPPVPYPVREGRALEEHSFPLFQQRNSGWMPSQGFPG